MAAAGVRFAGSIWPKFLTNCTAVAPIIAGIAMRKLNSTAHLRCRPISMAAQMVAPLLEIPGIMAAACASPTIAAASKPNCLSPVLVFFLRSVTISKVAVTTHIRATVRREPRAEAKYFSNNNPRTAVTMVATVARTSKCAAGFFL